MLYVYRHCNGQILAKQTRLDSRCQKLSRLQEAHELGIGCQQCRWLFLEMLCKNETTAQEN